MRRSTDLESRETFGVFVLLRDVFYSGVVGTCAAPLHGLADRVGGAFEDGFDATVGEVSGPAGEAEAGCLLACGVAEENALHVARDQDVGSLVFAVGVGHRGSSVAVGCGGTPPRAFGVFAGYVSLVRS